MMNNEEANESVNQLCLTGSSTGGELHSVNGGEGSPPSKNATSNDEGLEADVDREREWSPRSHDFNDDQGDESDDLLANEDEDDPLEISGKSNAGTGIPTLPLALAENSSLTDPNGEDDDDDDSDGWSNGQPYGRVSHGDNRLATGDPSKMLNALSRMAQQRNLDEEDDGDEDIDEEEDDEEEDEEEEVVVLGGTSENVDEKHCWVCFASEEDDPDAQWTHPCKCRGTTKWIHQACIQRWVFEKQKGNMAAQVACPQCGHVYRISYPAGGIVVITLDSFEKMTQKISPIMFGGLCVGTVYWFGITFGAVTIMQTVGEERGQVILERADPIFLIFALPLVPIGLVLGRMIPWEEPVLKTLRMVVPKVPILRNVLPAFSYVPDSSRPPVPPSIPPVTNPICVTRTICSGLMYPSLAAFLGWALYSGTAPESQLKRTLLGGATVFLLEGALSLYHKQHTYIRHSEWKIQNFDEQQQTANSADQSSS